MPVGHNYRATMITMELLQGDQKISVHLMSTVQYKTRKNILKQFQSLTMIK
jgi:hypothetical protein